MACIVDIKSITENSFIQDRPWLNFKYGDAIFIKESMDALEAAERELKIKINQNNFEAVTKTYASAWNKIIREKIPELSTGVYYATIDYNVDTGKAEPCIKIFINNLVEKELKEASNRILKEQEAEQQRKWTNERIEELKRNNDYNYNNANLISLEELSKNNKIKAGDIKIENGKTTYVTKENPYLRDYTSNLTKEKATNLFNKKIKSSDDYAQLAKYFATYFVNEIIEKDPTLKTMYGRLESNSKTKPKILIVDSNKRTSPFTQVDNTIVVGLWQLEQYRPYRHQ